MTGTEPERRYLLNTTESPVVDFLFLSLFLSFSVSIVAFYIALVCTFISVSVLNFGNL